MLVHATEHVQRGRLANVSLGGVLITTLVTMPARLLGQPLRLEVRLDGQEGGWLGGSGKVSRIAATTVAIAFEALSPELREAIGATASSSHAHGRVMNVVLIDADVVRRTQMLVAFRNAGCAVVDAASPLEAIVRLGESMFEPDLIAIADSLPTTISGELRDFALREHPQAKLVTIGSEVAEPDGIAHWLSSLDPAADMRSRVREMLGRPRRPTRP